jgi:hypothetical protein
MNVVYIANAIFQASAAKALFWTTRFITAQKNAVIF